MQIEEVTPSTEKEIKEFMLKVTEHLNTLFPTVGFSLTLFDHFDHKVLAQATNTEVDLTQVFQQMIEFTQSTNTKTLNKQMGNA